MSRFQTFDHKIIFFRCKWFIYAFLETFLNCLNKTINKISGEFFILKNYNIYIKIMRIPIYFHILSTEDYFSWLENALGARGTSPDAGRAKKRGFYWWGAPKFQGRVKHCSIHASQESNLVLKLHRTTFLSVASPWGSLGHVRGAPTNQDCN